MARWEDSNLGVRSSAPRTYSVDTSRSPGSVEATSFTPSFSKSNKKPGLSRVWCSPHKMHSDPHDTTPQMTRFEVILTMSPLKVLSIASIHRHHFRVLL